MPTFKVPAGCRQAMTDLHKAHNARYDRVMKKVEERSLQDSQVLAAFMDTHKVLHNAVDHALNKGGDWLPASVRNRLETAHVYSGDVWNSLVRGHRGPGVGRETREGQPHGSRLAGTFIDPEKHLDRLVKDLRRRYP